MLVNTGPGVGNDPQYSFYRIIIIQNKLIKTCHL